MEPPTLRRDGTEQREGEYEVEHALEHAQPKEQEARIMVNRTEQPLVVEAQLDAATTGDLLKEAFAEAKDLVRLEVKLAKEEVKTDVKSATGAAIGFGVAVASSLLMLTMLAVALVLAIGPHPWAALLVAGGFLVVCAVAAAVGYTMIPKKPFERTIQRVESDVNQLKEHVA